MDPLHREYPHYSPYSFAGNKVIKFKELEGLEEKDAIYDWMRGQATIILDWQDKRSGLWKGIEHLTSGTLLILSGAGYSIGTEGIGAAAGGGFLITLGSAEMGLGMVNLFGDPRSDASRANNALELVGMRLEENHGLTNASAYLYYGQEVIEVGTSIKNAYNFIKSGQTLRVPKNLRDVVKNSKAFYGVYTTAVRTPSKTGKLLFEGLYDVFVANTPTEALRNLDLESWKATIEFTDANINKVEDYIGVNIGFEVLDNDGNLFVSDETFFEIENEGKLQGLINDLKRESPERKIRKESIERFNESMRKQKRYICFVKGTQVWVENDELKNIEEIKVGDLVYSYDFEKHLIDLKSVLATKQNIVKGLVTIKLNNNSITSTSEHPFYVKDKGWTAANKLKNGDLLQTIKGKLMPIENIEISNNEEKVYNLQINKNSNYYVSKSGVLVHNDSYIEDLDLSKDNLIEDKNDNKN